MAFTEHGGYRIESPEQIHFVDKLHGWMRDPFSIWRTEDGGINWVRCLVMGEYESKVWQPIGASFLNASTAWVSSTNGLIHRTTDGGKTWHTKKIVASGLDVDLVQFINEHIGWTKSSDGYIYRSDDGGSTWQRQEYIGDRINIKSIHFVSSKEGWAVGWQARADRAATQEVAIQGIVFHTANGGRNWELTRVNITEPFFNYIYFADVQHGWLFGRDSVYRTEDRGKTWRIVLQLPSIAGGK